MNGLRKFELDTFLGQRFEDAPFTYNVVSVSHENDSISPQICEKPMSLSEIESKANNDPLLLLVKVPFEPPAPVHTFHTSASDCHRLLQLFGIDECGLGLVANDMTGFQQLNSESSDRITSYYIYGGAWKVLFSYNSVSGATKAVAFINTSRRGSKGFGNYIAALAVNLDLVRHPLLVSLTAVTEIVAYIERTLRGLYDKCRLAERNTGIHPWMAIGREEEVIKELSELSPQLTAVLVETEMILRRLRQLQLALEMFSKIQMEHSKNTGKNSPTVTNVLDLTRTKLQVMELDLLYVRARAKNQLNAISQQMTRDDTLASIELARSAARDSSSMKVIALMTMVFLPGTFFAALFAVPSLQWDSEYVVQDKFWVYWAFTLPFTAFVLILWIYSTQWQELRRLQQSKARRGLQPKRNDEENKVNLLSKMKHLVSLKLSEPRNMTATERKDSMSKV